MTLEPVDSALLDVRDLTIEYGAIGRSGPLTAVREVSLRLRQGEFVSLVGQSGSGKSTLVNAILGLLPRTARMTTGSIAVGGVDLGSAGDRELRRLRGGVVGFVPQDPGTSLNPVKRIGAQVEDAIRAHQRVSRDEARERALERLEAAGLTDASVVAQRYPHELSGGMKQRVLIAIALANHPPLILADEPTSALDVTVQKRILDHLDSVRETFGVGVLLVTHDLGIAAERADRVLVMNRGQIVEEGSAADILHRPAQPYTQRLVDSAPHISARRLRPTVTVADRDGPNVPAGGSGILRLEGVTKHYRSRGTTADVVALSNVSLALREGTTHAVVGESGAGKSTLARIAVGLDSPTDGTVTFAGARLDTATPRQLREYRRNIQFVHQNPYASLDPRYKVADLIAEPLDLHHVTAGRSDREQRVRSLIDSVHLDQDHYGRRPRELSGGQRQRVAIARSLALNPRLLVLDEAVSALDVVVQSAILQLLVDLQEQLSLSFLFITHDLGVVRQIADDVTVMRGGEVVESGPTAEVLTSRRSAYTAELLDAVPLARGTFQMP